MSPAMPSWEEILLSNLITDIRYGTSEKANSLGIGIPILRIPNVIGGNIDFSDLRYIEGNANEIERYRLENNDILLVRTNANPEYIGRCALFKEVPGVWLFASYLLRIQVDSNRVLPEFLNRYLQSDRIRRRFKALAHTSAGNYNINIQDVESLHVSLPPLNEQQVIEWFLRRVDSCFKVSEQAIARYNILKKGLLQRLLTHGIGHTRFKQTKIGEIPESWEVVKLGNFATSRRRTIEPREFPTETFELYSIPAFHEKGVPELVQGAEIGSMKQLVSKRSVLFGALNPRVPKIWFVATESNLRKIASSEFICLEGNERANPRFLYHLCQTSRLLMKSMTLTRGSTPSRMRVDRSVFLSTPVPRPPIEEQKEIAWVLDTLEAIIGIDLKLIEKLGALKKGLMQLLLSGKVRVKA